jgi:XTP/dITP diphosphohydrolase
MRIVLATTNEGKVAEVRRILSDLDVEVLTAAEVELPAVEEVGETFVENALAKARSAVAATRLPALADDSGLVVDQLDGAPGVRSARYAGPGADDEANLKLVLENLLGAPARSARFVCVAALVAPSGREWTVEGVLDGHIVDEPRGVNGFGYDPIFQPVGELRTLAEMSPDDKDAISHRGRAFRAIRGPIAELVDSPDLG